MSASKVSLELAYMLNKEVLMGTSSHKNIKGHPEINWVSLYLE